MMDTISILNALPEEETQLMMERLGDLQTWLCRYACHIDGASDALDIVQEARGHIITAATGAKNAQVQRYRNTGIEADPLVEAIETSPATIVERLRAWKSPWRDYGDENPIPLAAKAAYYIEAQAAEIERLQERNAQLYGQLMRMIDRWEQQRAALEARGLEIREKEQ